MHRPSQVSPPNLACSKTNQNEKFLAPRFLGQPFGHIKSAFQPSNLKNQHFQNFPNLGPMHRPSQVSPPNLACFKTNHNEIIIAPRFLGYPFGHIKSAFQPSNLKNQHFQNFPNLGPMHRPSQVSPPNLASFKTNQNEIILAPRFLGQPFGHIKSAIQPTNLKSQHFENFPFLPQVYSLSPSSNYYHLQRQKTYSL